MAKDRNDKQNKDGKKSFNRNSKGPKKDSNGIKFVKTKGIKKVDENTKSLRRLYNRLMQKPKNEKKKEANKEDIVKSIMKNINGNYQEVCFKHDGCRVLQGSIKYGSKKQRNEIIQNLLPHLFNLINGKYSIYLAMKIFKYASNDQKTKIITDTVLPNFGKILKNTNGHTFTKIVFANCSTEIQDTLVNHYIDKYLKIPFEKIKALGLEKKEEENKNEYVVVELVDTFEQDKTKEELKKHLEKQLEKEIHKSHIFQAFLDKIYDHLDLKSKSYISELFDDDIYLFIDHKIGVDISCKLYTVGSAKTRKKIIKKIKDNMSSIMSNEISILFLIKIILFTDDTKLVEKHILKFLIEQMHGNFSSNKVILKIFSNILNPFDKKINKLHENNILLYDKDNSSKKEASKRHEEIFMCILEDLHKIVNYELRVLMTDFSYSYFLSDYVAKLITVKEYTKLNELLKNVIENIENDCRTSGESVELSILADNIGHLIIKRIMKNLSNEAPDQLDDFTKGISKILLGNLDMFINTKAVFIAIQIMENPKTKKYLEKEMKKRFSSIAEIAKDTSLKGIQILYNILK